jgi:very-short-patch-repair endonuclease
LTSKRTEIAAKRANSLKSNMTEAERALWNRIRNRQLGGFKFVRQQPIGPYIADFVCRQADLIIELDGSQHADSSHDEKRTKVLNEHGYEVVRFWNNEVLRNLDGVLHIIADRLEQAPSPGHRFATSDLSPKGRGEGRQATGRNT